MKRFNPNHSKTLKDWTQNTLIGLSSALLIACGGGGGGAEGVASDSNTQAPTDTVTDSVSYEPNADKLLQDADSSSELYVEQDFMFDHTRLTQLDLSVSDSEGNPHSHTRVKVYVVNLPEGEDVPEQWNDELNEHASLIAGGLTNANGELARVIEFAGNGNTDQYLLLEVNVVGIENKTLVPVTSARTQVSL